MNDKLPACAGKVPIATDEAHVWKVRLDVDSGRYAEHLEFLSLEERRRADEFRLDAPRRKFVLARSVLRTLLAGYLDTTPTEIRLCIDGNAKPQLDVKQNALDMRFNVAHSGGLALIAVTRGCDVGVDVEQLRPVHHAAEIASRYFHPAEIQSIVGASPIDRDNVFLRCWTLKEAVLKAVGTGITSSLGEFAVRCDSHESGVAQVIVKVGGKPTQIFMERLHVGDGYLAAIALLESPRRVNLFDFIA